MTDDRILEQITPPPGGWQRLASRRDAPRPEKGLGLPLAATAVLALAAFLLRPQSPQALQLPWNSARLLAQPSEGAGLRRVGGAQVTSIPSDDARVRLYWVEHRAKP
jgi:hypothetical protein